MLIDTDIIIWYLKENLLAKKALAKLPSLNISVITYMELVQGMKNKRELEILRYFLREQSVKVIYIDQEISIKAMFYVEQYYLSHSLQLADALIASTAVTHGLGLLTGNDKHYQMITELSIKKFRP